MSLICWYHNIVPKSTMPNTTTYYYCQVLRIVRCLPAILWAVFGTGSLGIFNSTDQMWQADPAALDSGHSFLKHQQQHPKFLLNLQAEAMGLHHASTENSNSGPSTEGMGDTFTLRLAAIFVILAAGLIGVMPPLIGSWLSGSPNSVTARLIRACSGGIILALAMIHIIPESLEQLEGLAGSLPLGGIMVISGLLAMMMLEYISTWLSVKATAAQQADSILPVSTQHTTAAAAVPAAAPESPVHAHDETEACNKLCKTFVEPSVKAGGHCTHHAPGVDHHHHHHHHHNHHVDVVPSLSHSHDCKQQPACRNAAVRQQVAAFTMEVGCVFHSVVLGLALGVMSDSPQLVMTMMIVLAVHQAVEGLAIGSVLAAVQRMSQQKKYLFAVVYALTLPAGIAAGLLGSASYNPESPAAQMVQGVANGLSGGMLLYVSLFTLLAAEFNQHDLLHRPLLAAALLMAVLTGAGVMCVLGVWA